ncbi:MAG: DNA-formamidopyrimidine glycosylase [Legionellales bacterium]|nr:DNA-formamidopyrimidine glycosylase [Legionellales bacterium]OUX67056.1 MAG: DNA-formamidopyrimidine glycosylase [bacterium TMED178]
MPELPEVETTRQGIMPYFTDQRIDQLLIRQKKFRYEVNFNDKDLIGQTGICIYRRAKYLILEYTSCVLLIHLGMSGSLRMLEKTAAIKKHDHLFFQLSNGLTMVYHDPRRFGFILKYPNLIALNQVFHNLGPEPLSDCFNNSYFKCKIARSNRPIKSLLMDQKVVVGVGNIYATEALFLAGIHPDKPGATLSDHETTQLVLECKIILKKAIANGGTTLRDFVSGHGQPGYFKQSLHVYGRSGESCYRCNTTIEKQIIGQRTSSFCPQCQH